MRPDLPEASATQWTAGNTIRRRQSHKIFPLTDKNLRQKGVYFDAASFRTNIEQRSGRSTTSNSPKNDSEDGSPGPSSCLPYWRPVAVSRFGIGRVVSNWGMLEIATRAVTKRKEKNVVYTHAISVWKFEIEGKDER